MTDWCILRSPPSLTIRLTDALGAAGYTAWTPVEIVVRRVARSRKRIERRLPITPSFVFASYSSLTELIALARSESMTHLVWDRDQRRMVQRGFPQFTVFRSMGAYPRISDASLNPLRLIERRRKPAVKPTEFKVGDEVQYPDAGFEGLTGKVEGVRGRYTLVIFPGLPIAVQIDPRFLRPAQRAA